MKGTKGNLSRTETMSFAQKALTTEDTEDAEELVPFLESKNSLWSDLAAE
jgi:hypothetical protein